MHTGLTGFRSPGGKFCDFLEFDFCGASGEEVGTSMFVGNRALPDSKIAHTRGRPADGHTLPVCFQVDTRGPGFWGSADMWLG